MGYEIKIIYHPKEEGGYDLSQRLEKTKRIGKAMDPRDDETLAQEILRQFSRRDVLVSDVEVVEFARKPLKVKTAKNGCVIVRGKRYSLVGSAVEVVEVVESEEAEGKPEQDGEDGVTEAHGKAPQKKRRPPRPRKQRVLRKEVFDPPHPHQAKRYKSLTIGQQYDVIQEINKGSILRVIDNRRAEIDIPSEFFSAPEVGLDWGRAEAIQPEKAAEIQLSYGPGGDQADSMPNLRT